MAGSIWQRDIDVDADGNATISGNLTVNGTTTALDTTNTVIKDKLIELGNGTSGTPSGDAGVIVERGSSTNAGLVWDESLDKWTLCTTSATGGSTGDLTLTPTASLVSTLGMKEQANADADVAAIGQLWVKTATPNELYFTTDAGDDIQITSGTSIAGGGGGAAADDANTILHMQVFA